MPVDATPLIATTIISTPMISTEELAWAEVTRRIMPDIWDGARSASLSRGLNERDLVKQLLLHLPRFSPEELLGRDVIPVEADRLARKLQELRGGFSTWTQHSKLAELRKADFSVQECDVRTADEIHTRFHYIGTVREAVVHLGIYVPGLPDRPMALASLSEMDIDALNKYLPSLEAKKTSLVVSRVFAFDWAPRNSISFLLGRVAAWVRTYRPEVQRLLTYLNPNLGFNGASYLAANWLPLTEMPVRYFYLKNNYITYRSFIALPADLKAQVVTSVYKLDPLRMLGYEIRK
jgi:hypothetical protein